MRVRAACVLVFADPTRAAPHAVARVRAACVLVFADPMRAAPHAVARRPVRKFWAPGARDCEKILGTGGRATGINADHCVLFQDAAMSLLPSPLKSPANHAVESAQPPALVAQ